MKHCNKCNKNKEDIEFVFKNKKLNIRHSICKECQREYKIKYYQNNKESHFIRNKIKIEKLKQIVNSFKVKGCSNCNEKDFRCLDFHHINIKNNCISNLIKLGNEKKLVKEINKCIVLCANCHRKLHIKL